MVFGFSLGVTKPYIGMQIAPEYSKVEGTTVEILGTAFLWGLTFVATKVWQVV